MRRAAGALVPLEIAILDALLGLRAEGAGEAHGYLIAGAVRVRSDARRLTAYGTLYKALDRLERSGFLASRWEVPDTAAREGRPRRRYYHVTVAGATAVADAATGVRERSVAAKHPRRREAPAT